MLFLCLCLCLCRYSVQWGHVGISISIKLLAEQLQNTPPKSRRGKGLRVYASSFSGGRILERGNLLCAGYVWSLDHRTKQFPMSWLRVYAWLRVKIKAKSTGVRSVLSWNLDHRTKQFLMWWLRVYAWLRVKIKARVLVFRDHQFKLVATRGLATRSHA